MRARTMSRDEARRVLGVQVDVEDEQLRRAWRARVAVTHPDRTGKDDSAEFLRVQEAYELLREPEPVDEVVDDEDQADEDATAAPVTEAAAPVPVPVVLARMPRWVVWRVAVAGMVSGVLVIAAYVVVPTVTGVGAAASWVALGVTYVVWHATGRPRPGEMARLGVGAARVGATTVRQKVRR